MKANTTHAKLSILVTQGVKRRLEGEARAKKTTVGDIVRRRLGGELEGEERLFIEALIDLGRRAKSIILELDATRAALERDRVTRTERENEIRKATLASLADHDRLPMFHALRWLMESGHR